MTCLFREPTWFPTKSPTSPIIQKRCSELDGYLSFGVNQIHYEKQYPDINPNDLQSDLQFQTVSELPGNRIGIKFTANAKWTSSYVFIQATLGGKARIDAQVWSLDSGILLGKGTYVAPSVVRHDGAIDCCAVCAAWLISLSTSHIF